MIGRLARRTSAEEFLAAFRRPQSADRSAVVLCSCRPGDRPRGFGFPILAQFFALFEHEGLGVIEVGVNARALDGVTGSATGYQIARILLSFASPRNHEIY